MPPKPETTSIYQEYFDATDKYLREFGPNCLVLMQVGSFFEVYGLRDSPNGQKGSRIEEFCKICSLKMAEKSKDRYKDCSLYMAGFGEYNLEKYLKILTEAGFNVVVFVQEDDMRKAGAKRRVFNAVYSAGTFMSIEDTAETVSNHIMCVWVNKYTGINRSPRYLCGFSVVNILSGQSYLYEYTTTQILSPTSFDELDRAISSFLPSEIIFIHQDDGQQEAETEQIIQFTGMNRCKTLHRVSESLEKVQRLSKQAYIDTTLATYLGKGSCDICAEFTTYEFATRCFVYLLDFLQGHNPNLVRKIEAPLFSNNSSRVILANHTLKQLNILGPGGVLNFLNQTKTAMGSRLFQYQIQNPTFDVDWLLREYDAIDWAISLGYNTLFGVTAETQSQSLGPPEASPWKQVRETVKTQSKLFDIQQHLSKIRDIERIGRRLLLGKVYPASLYELYRGIHEFSNILSIIGNIPFFTIDKVKISEFKTFMESRICLEVCEGMTNFDFVETAKPLFLPELGSKELIEALKQLENSELRLQSFCDGFNALFTKGSEVKIHETAKSGSSLQLTQARGIQLRNIFQKNPKGSIQVNSPEASNDYFLENFLITSSGGVSTIDSPVIQATCKDILKWKNKVSALSMAYFQEFLQMVETDWLAFLLEQAKLIALLDVVVNKAQMALQYHYCRPEIDTNHDAMTSYFDAKDLRHVLIEHLQKNELYVANDLQLGTANQRGILLYGTNAVGKTSIIKAAGIAVVMAQAGMYVPASQFRYCPYRAIYSRILGNDDIFRGLSTFVVEMSELRVILKSADEYSLVLGDELCSGTETESALSIFVAGLQHLYEKDTSFLFATHFHEIVHYEEIRAMTADALQLKHLSVHYDHERGTLVYDRKLRQGSGDAIYGLEVARSLFMPAVFLENAFQLRTKYFPKTAKVSPLSCKQSRYNADKIRVLCERCQENAGAEIHHIIPQHLADSKGFISGGPVHKNHKANLMSLCDACHLKYHT